MIYLTNLHLQTSFCLHHSHQYEQHPRKCSKWFSQAYLLSVILLFLITNAITICSANSNPSSDLNNLPISTQFSNGIYLLPPVDSHGHPDLFTSGASNVVYFALLLPLHQAKPPLPVTQSGICSNELNSAAIYDLEAALWTLDRLLLQKSFSANVKFRPVVVDSCGQSALLTQRVKNLLQSEIWSPISRRLLTFVSSTPSEQLVDIFPLLAVHNMTLFSAQDITWALSNQNNLVTVSPPYQKQLRALQTALPPSHYAQTAIAFLKSTNRSHFSLLHSTLSQTSLSASTPLFSSFIQLTEAANRATSNNSKTKLCIQSSVSLPKITAYGASSGQLDSATASQVLMQLQHDLLLLQEHNANQNAANMIAQHSIEQLQYASAPNSSTSNNINANTKNVSSEVSAEERIRMFLRNDEDEEEDENEADELDNELQERKENNGIDEQLVLLATESTDTRALLTSYQHLLNAGLLGRMRFVLLRESNLNVVSGLEQSLLRAIVLREHQPSLADFVQHFARLRTTIAYRRNPFFGQFWQEVSRCASTDCYFRQIEPVHTLNTMQAVALALESASSLKDLHCSGCGWTSNILQQVRPQLVQQVLTRGWSMNQLSAHFSGTLRFELLSHCNPNTLCPVIPIKGVDVLRFRRSDSHFRFDRLHSMSATGNAPESLSSESVNWNATLQRLYCHSSLILKHLVFNTGSNANSLTSDQSPISASNAYSIVEFFEQDHSQQRRGVQVLSLVGVLLVLLCYSYLFVTLDCSYGTTMLGYLILAGLLGLYLVNFLFLLQSGSYAFCWLRNFCMAAAYAIVSAGLLVKVLNAWRLNGLLGVQMMHNNGPMPEQANSYPGSLHPVVSSEGYGGAYILSYGPTGAYFHSNSSSQQPTTYGSAGEAYSYTTATTSTRNSPRSLLLMCIGLICLQCLTSVLWLSIYPPRALSFPGGVYRCVSTFNPSAFSLVDMDAISSLLFVSLLLLITIYFALLCWRQPVNQHECRWILLCSYLTAMSWLCWALLVKLRFVHNRDLSIALVNFFVASVLFICLFVRKVFAFERLRRQLKSKTLASSPRISKNQGKRKLGPFNDVFSQYGTLRSVNDNSGSHQRNDVSQDNHNYSGNLPDTDKMPCERSRAESLDNLDAVSTISGMTTTSSIISSVRGYFKGHQRSDSNVSASEGSVSKTSANRSENTSKKSHRQNQAFDNLHSTGEFILNKKKRTLSSESAAVTLAGNGLSSNILLGSQLDEHQVGQLAVDPLAAELYPMDVYDAGQPTHGSSMLNTKNDIFNSNRSLYLMDENGFM